MSFELPGTILALLENKDKSVYLNTKNKIYRILVANFKSDLAKFGFLITTVQQFSIALFFQTIP